MATVTTAQNGDWNTAGTWTGGSVPTMSDDAVINHAVTISSDVEIGNIEIGATGSLTTPDSWGMSTTPVLLCAGIITMDRVLDDDRRVRLDGIEHSFIVPVISCVGTYANDGFPTTGTISKSADHVIIDDPGLYGFSAQMQDIKPEGCGMAYARKVSNGVRYLNVVIHIKSGDDRIVGQLYRMAESPFQVLAVTNSAAIKGYIEAITPMDSVGKEYRAFKVSIAEGL